jgi:hypothetical protein
LRELHPNQEGSALGEINVSAEGAVAAPAETVYGYIADFREHHPKFLPPSFSNLTVEQGGVGAGTVHSFEAKAGGRTRHYRMRVDEPQPGSVLTESDMDSSLVTRFTVTPAGDGCSVRIETTWQGAGGVGGFFERLFAPRVMRRVYADELQRLDRYARERASA